jgi:alpha-L-fucosidase
MRKQAADRARDAKSKDQEEIEAKRREYAPFLECPDKGILRDLRDVFDLDGPTLQHLLPIAQTLAHKIGEVLDRQDKRRREFVIGWLNKHYDEIREYIPRLVIRDDRGTLRGPHADALNRYEEENPTAPVFKYINGDLPL